MNFDLNQTEFPSYSHKYVWKKLSLLTPPDISLDDMDKDKKAKFAQVYDYFRDTFHSLYDELETYNVNYKKIDAAMGGRPWNEAVYISKNSGDNIRLSTLHELLRIDFIANFPHLAHSLHIGEVRDGYITITSDVFESEILKKFEETLSMTRENVINILKKMGFTYERIGENVNLVILKYPKLFRVIEYSNKFMESNKIISHKYYIKCALNMLDFRIFNPKFKLDFEHTKWFMPDDMRNFMEKVNLQLKKKKLSLKKNDNTSTICLCSDYKKQHLVNLHCSEHTTELRIMLNHPTSKEFKLFEEKVLLSKNSANLISFCLKNIRGCIPGTTSANSDVTIFGKGFDLTRKKIYIRLDDFSIEHFDVISEFIDIQYSVISDTTKVHIKIK